MVKKTILFDIDRTLIDSVKIRELTRGGMCQELGLNREEINRVIDDYVLGLRHKNDFSREKMLKWISLKTGVKHNLLKAAHDRPEYYLPSLYSEVTKTLKGLRAKGWRLGVFSEGFEAYQTDKLKLSGIHEYFDKDKIFIEKRKLRESVVDRIAEAIVVDDNIEVIDYLTRFPKILPVWVNRKTTEIHQKAKTIFSLSELIKWC